MHLTNKMAELTSPEELSKLKVADLKKALKERGLSNTGSKSELVERLFNDVTKGRLEEDTDAAKEADNVLDEEDDDDNVAVTMKEEAVQKEISSPKKDEVAKEPTPVQKEEPAAETSASGTTSSPEAEKPFKAVKVTGGTETDKLKKRAERFGIINEDIKKLSRAERFGLPTSGSGAKLSAAGSTGDVDVLKRRAERFGQVISSTLSKVDEDERIKKRKERFGDVTSAENNAPPSKFTKISFNSSDLEEKKKKRADRFGLS